MMCDTSMAFFFFKQKTAYDLRISDWSSDVCSSDLLRHAMVVNRILEWYRTGINPQERLPFLATYLGHRDINSTLVYITVTQELLHLANERFRTMGAQCLSLGREAQP